MTRKSVQERFWSKVNRDNDDGCWEWVGGKVRGGYGWFKSDDKHYQAHRFVWMITYGEIPNGMLICHTCDNPSCVNPKHLWLGTDKTNAEDRVRKKRQSRGTTNHPKIRVSPEQVKEMRKVYSLGNISMRKLASIYGICYSETNAILNHRTWKDVLE